MSDIETSNKVTLSTCALLLKQIHFKVQNGQNLTFYNSHLYLEKSTSMLIGSLQWGTNIDFICRAHVNLCVLMRCG